MQGEQVVAGSNAPLAAAVDTATLVSERKRRDDAHAFPPADDAGPGDMSRPLHIRRGDIFYADLSPVIGSEQGGVRPVLVLQNDIGNKYSPTVIVSAITSQVEKAKLPIHIELESEAYGLERDSVILLEQIRTVDKRRLRERVTRLDAITMNRVNEALMISLGLQEL